MKIASKLSLVAIVFASLMGCSYFQFPGVHKIYVQQGHVITQEMIDQLEPGMTKRQVRYVLGTPLLEDGFKQDRWDYHYGLRRGDESLRKRHLTVYFDGDAMTRYEGSAVRSDDDGESDGEDAPLVPSNIEGIDPLPDSGAEPDSSPDPAPNRNPSPGAGTPGADMPGAEPNDPM